VVLKSDLSLDAAATEALRRDLRGKANGNGAGVVENKGGVQFTDLTKFATGVTV
jgi:hypothetical protein